MQLTTDIHIHSEDSIMMYFAKTPSKEVLKHILSFQYSLKNQLPEYYNYSIPSYVSLLIHYNIDKISATQMIKKLALIQPTHTDLHFTTHHITVDYNFKDGLDLKRILQEKSISLDNFIAIHTSKEYDAYSIGFLENFAYLGNVDKKICIPRLDTPRQNIAKNSVGIADCQTGIYPKNSAAGWNIIGLAQNLPTFSVGDRVKFSAV